MERTNSVIATGDLALNNLKSREMSSVRVGTDRGAPADIYYKTYGKLAHEPVILVMGFLGRGDL